MFLISEEQRRISTAPYGSSSKMVGMKPEYHEGAEARQKFEQGMAKLFKAKKPIAKETPKATPKRKRGKAGKG